MKKKITPIIALFAAVTALFAFSACSTPKIPGEEGYIITFEEELAEVTVGERSTLPLPSATDPQGNGVSGEVNVEVLFRDGTVYLPKHSYSFSSEFTAYIPGEYYAVYTVERNGSTVAKNIITIKAVEGSESDIKVDGVLDEASYSAGYSTGVGGNMLFKYRFAENGVYVGVEVSDTQLVYNSYLVSRFTQSDGFEICFNFSGEESDRLNSSCRKLRVSLNGEAYICTPSAAMGFYEVNEGMTASLVKEIRLHGTRSCVGKEEIASLDIDKGYIFEAFLSYGALGVDAPGEYIGIAFSHRDMTSTEAVAAVLGGVGNRWFSTAVLPDGIRPILGSNGKDYEYSNTEELALTCLYERLYIKGGYTGVAVPQVSCSVKTDGIADEAAWAGAKEIDCKAIKTVSVSAKAFVDNSGLYLFAEISDKTADGTALDDIFAGDSFQVRIASQDMLSSKRLPAGFNVNGKIVTADPAGGLQKSCLNPKKLLYICGFDIASAVKRSENGYAVEIFIPHYVYGGGTPGVCIGVADNKGSEYAGAAGMKYSCTEEDPSAYARIGG